MDSVRNRTVSRPVAQGYGKYLVRWAVLALLDPPIPCMAAVRWSLQDQQGTEGSGPRFDTTETGQRMSTRYTPSKADEARANAAAFAAVGHYASPDCHATTDCPACEMAADVYIETLAMLADEARFQDEGPEAPSFEMVAQEAGPTQPRAYQAELDPDWCWTLARHEGDDGASFQLTAEEVTR